MIIVPSWDLVWTVGDLFVNFFLTFFFFDGVFEKNNKKQESILQYLFSMHKISNPLANVHTELNYYKDITITI